MPLSFPGSPSVNDTYTVGQRTWTWDGYIWSLSADTIGSASVTSSEIASSAVTTAKIADANVTAAKIASNAVTTAKILDANVTTGKVAANAITQAKLASNLSAVTVTTTANRDTDIATPFTGQLAILTDTKKIQLYDGTSWVNVSLAPPETPTSLSATALSTTSVSIAFTAGGANGSPITNYKYALSTNGGSTYGSFTALDPADTTTPITISGLTQNTAYYIKLKAVNDMGDSVASSAVSISTLNAITVDYLVVAGGGGGGHDVGGGGGAGGLRSTVTNTGGGGALETPLNMNYNTNYAIVIGNGGAGDTDVAGTGTNGGNSSFSTITSTGGGGGGSHSYYDGLSGGSGGGGAGYGTNPSPSAGRYQLGGAGTANQGYAGGTGNSASILSDSGGGGGAGGAGTNATVRGSNAEYAAGGVGVTVAITGSNVTYATGGKGGGDTWAGSANGAANTGNGGDGAGSSSGSAGGSGVVILRYLTSAGTITIGAGLTGSTATSGSYKVTTITAGTGNVSWA